MNFLREMVSKNKVRFKDEDYNLDLTYITPRIIAMSFPALGFESMYRNKIKDVSRFLNQRHGQSYLVVNASDRNYDYRYFNNNVFNVKWPDRYPCAFLRFLKLILSICFYMLKDRDNTVAVHCLMGKGRTGSLISALLFISGLFDEISQANGFYLSKRACNVSKPSQLRYMSYFSKFYQQGKKALNLNVRKLISVTLKTAKSEFFINNNFRLIFYDHEDGMKELLRLGFDGTNCSLDTNARTYLYNLDSFQWNHTKVRDILVVLRHRGLINYSKLFYVNLNLFFIENSFTLAKSDLDAAGSDIPFDFTITFNFEEKEDETCKRLWEEEIDVIEDGFNQINAHFKTNADRNTFLYG